MKTEALAKNLQPKIEQIDIVIKCDSISAEEKILIQDTSEYITIDLKNREVVLSIREYKISNYYRMLVNLLADTNISLFVKKTEPVYEKNKPPVYKSSAPNILFECGKVTKHELQRAIRENEISKHILTFKFNRIDLKYDEVNYI